MKIFYDHIKGDIDVPLSLDLKPEMSLRILCNGAHSTDQFAVFLRNEMKSKPTETAAFVDLFVSTIFDALDLKDSCLCVKPEKTGGVLDFPRPSPSWLMLKLFIEGLSKDAALRAVFNRHASNIPHYIVMQKWADLDRIKISLKIIIRYLKN